jgi:hypothetical protein
MDFKRPSSNTIKNKNADERLVQLKLEEEMLDCDCCGKKKYVRDIISLHRKLDDVKEEGIVCRSCLVAHSDTLRDEGWPVDDELSLEDEDAAEDDT